MATKTETAGRDLAGVSITPSKAGAGIPPFLRLVVERPYGEPGTYIGDEHTALVAKLYDGQEHYATLFAAAPEMLAALAGLLKNQEDGWRATGTMPEEHIKSMPYLKAARAAIALAEGRA